MLKKGLCQGNLRRDLEPREAFARAAQAGFDGVELRITADGKVALPPPYDEPDRAAELLRSVGLEATTTGGPGFVDLFHLEPDESLPQIVARMEAGLPAVRALGADATLQIPGYVQLMWDPKCPVIPYDVAWERSLTIYRAIAPIAEKHGVTLCVENVWNRFLLSPREFAEFVDAVGSPRVQAYFDVGNVVVNSFPEQWLRILGSRVHRIHLKDFQCSIGNLQGFVMLLEGDVNWREVMAAVREIGYDGYLTAEYGPYRHAPDVLLNHLSASMDAIVALAGA